MSTPKDKLPGEIKNPLHRRGSSTSSISSLDTVSLDSDSDSSVSTPRRSRRGSGAGPSSPKSVRASKKVAMPERDFRKQYESLQSIAARINVTARSYSDNRRQLAVLGSASFFTKDRAAIRDVQSKMASEVNQFRGYAERYIKQRDSFYQHSLNGNQEHMLDYVHSTLLGRFQYFRDITNDGIDAFLQAIHDEGVESTAAAPDKTSLGFSLIDSAKTQSVFIRNQRLDTLRQLPDISSELLVKGNELVQSEYASFNEALEQLRIQFKSVLLYENKLVDVEAKGELTVPVTTEGILYEMLPRAQDEYQDNLNKKELDI